MFSPINWLKPRLRQLCVMFGVCDMTLVALSALCWYFTFQSAFEAQNLRSLYASQRKLNEAEKEEIRDASGDNSQAVIKKYKEDRSPEDLRLERTVRACGLTLREDGSLDEEAISDASNYAGPAALVGAAMGGFFVLGALLTSLNAMESHASRKTVCAVALFGEGISTFFLVIGVTMLCSNDGLCRTEYYYEYFQPIMWMFVLTMTFTFTYKTYEMALIAFYLGAQTRMEEKDKRELDEMKHEVGNVRRSLNKKPNMQPATGRNQGQGDAAMTDKPQKQRRISQDSQKTQGSASSVTRNRRGSGGSRSLNRRGSGGSKTSKRRGSRGSGARKNKGS